MRTNVLAGIGLAALVALPASGAGAESATPWIHVRVEEAKKQSRVHVNLPLTVVEAVLEAAPAMLESHAKIHMSEGKIHVGSHHGLKIQELRRIWKELAAAGDAELVTVEDEGETVKVWREGHQVHVRVVKEGQEEVRVEVPVSLVDAALSGEGDAIDVKAALAELKRKRGDIVQVNDGESVVRVWIDERNTQAR